MMEEFMTDNATDGAEKANCKNKTIVITICLWLLNVEPEALRINFITHYNKSPHPNYNLKENIELKWNVKPFVFFE